MPAPLQRIEELFHEALALPEVERPAFLQRVCDGDSELLREVSSLLQHAARDTANFAGAVQPVAADIVAQPSGIRPGSTLGPYRVDAKLGQGGMGEVFLARDTRLGRQVALKAISQAAAVGRSAEARARFLREARAAAALSHPNIAVLYDVGETDGMLWLVMEHVDGTPLRSRIGAPLAPDQWISWAQQIAAGMEHAHSRGIVHRDLKPENILVTPSGTIKIIDFGLARAIAAVPETSLTASKTFLGTITYAAPELLAGGQASAQSDVYSLGLVLYELACGEHPFARLSGAALVAAIMAGSFTPLSARSSSLPHGAVAVIDRCLSPEPARRYKDARELAAALRDLVAAAHLQPSVAPPLLAVLDFRNIGGSAQAEWLGTGLAETLSADLAKVKSVRMVSRNRVIQSLRRLNTELDDPAAVLDLGRDLGARWIVSGGYQQIGDRIRVTASLIDTSTGEAIAAEKIDGLWAEVFDVQDRVVAALLRSITAGFGITDRQRILPPETRNLAAWEHYVRGRRHLYLMDPPSLTAAIHHFEQAVGLDAKYAYAWSGLGTAHALLFIATNDPEDIARASRYLERAIEIDPELGEPYPWLNNIRLRRNDFAGALAAGRKAVELQPDLPEAHYFYGSVSYMAPEGAPDRVRSACFHIAESIRLDRRFHAGWVVLGAYATFLGRQREAIAILQEAVRIEEDPGLYYRFSGARTLLAGAHMRAGDFERARSLHLEALESLRDTPHIYTSCFQVLSTYGLGEVAMRLADPGSALTWYRRARQLLAESRRIVGGARLLLRVNAGLASAYAAAGEADRAAELADEVARTLAEAPPPLATITFESSLAQLWIGLAAAQARLGQLDEAAAAVGRACESGWADWRWLIADPEFVPLRGHAAFAAATDRLRSQVEEPFPMPLIPSSHSGTG